MMQYSRDIKHMNQHKIHVKSVQLLELPLNLTSHLAMPDPQSGSDLQDLKKSCFFYLMSTIFNVQLIRLLKKLDTCCHVLTNFTSGSGSILIFFKLCIELVKSNLLASKNSLNAIKFAICI